MFGFQVKRFFGEIGVSLLTIGDLHQQLKDNVLMAALPETAEDQYNAVFVSVSCSLPVGVLVSAFSHRYKYLCIVMWIYPATCQLGPLCTCVVLGLLPLWLYMDLVSFVHTLSVVYGFSNLSANISNCVQRCFSVYIFT